MSEENKLLSFVCLSGELGSSVSSEPYKVICSFFDRVASSKAALIPSVCIVKRLFGFDTSSFVRLSVQLQHRHQLRNIRSRWSQIPFDNGEHVINTPKLSRYDFTTADD